MWNHITLARFKKSAYNQEKNKEGAMLKIFRKKKIMKRILWGLAILIIPAFVLWGVDTA
jgi:hypothetical protein